MNLEIKYIGHSAFFVKTSEVNFLIDPFISQNPQATQANFNWQSEKIDAIFVTHGHADHLGDGIEISKATGAPIVAIFELANYCQNKGATVIPAGLGGKVILNNLKGLDAWFLPAFHSSSTIDDTYAGCAASILFETEGKRLYHAGDNALNSEFKVIGEFYKPDIAILPIGGHFTMGVKESVTAAKWLGVKTTIPMHYGTFPVINTDTKEFASLMDAAGLEYKLLAPGETTTL